LTGQAAGLFFNRLLAAAQGSFTLTGYDADLIYALLKLVIEEDAFILKLVAEDANIVQLVDENAILKGESEA
jgi:hypothetical protein